MTERERFAAVLHFRKPDRVPNVEIGYWEDTLARWRTEGLPPDMPAYPPPGDRRYTRHSRELTEYFHLDAHDVAYNVTIGMSSSPAPTAEVIAEDEQTRTYRYSNGYVTKCLKSNEGIFQELDWAVKTRRDWEAKVAWRYDPDTPGRFPDNWDELVAGWRDREVPLVVSAYPHLGMFGPLRDLIGIEHMAPLLYDDPEFIHDMAHHWGEFHYCLLEQIVSDVVPDTVDFWEDMAFHTAPLISPRMFMEFFGPHYRRINDLLIEAGVPVRGVDSDGDASQVIGPFLRCGMNYLWPLEVAAHMDAPVLRRRYGKQLLLHGNLDKRAIAAGPPAIDRELEAKIPVALEGGYLPTCDHSMPPDISWEAVQYYWRRKKELLGIEVE